MPDFMPMIQIRNLRKTYPGGARPAVNDLNLTVDKGEFLAVVGPSGCGKSTMLSMINRLIEPTAGEIVIGGADIRATDPVSLRRGIGFVFQDVGLFPHLSAGENVGITLRLMGRPREEIAARVDETLSQVRLPPTEYRARYPSALSGGQRQRVGVARALAAKPAIMLMDEPFGALDPLIRDELGAEYRDIHRALALTTMLVTHDMTEAFLLADRVAVMRDGALVQVGSPQELLAAPADSFVRDMIESPRRRARALAEAMRASEAS
jgi:osmoprotectant transport system ATP-binding protein